MRILFSVCIYVVTLDILNDLCNCDVLGCGDIDPPAHGHVSVSGEVRTGFVARYTCDEGYQLLGDTVRTCDGSLTWSAAVPVCQHISKYTL